MKSVVANAVAVAHEAAEALAGQAAKYFAEGGECEIAVTPGRRQSDDAGDDGTSVRSTQHDWLVDPTKLRIDGKDIVPELGHVIVVLDSGETFTVVKGNGQNCWGWNDQFRQRIRIHTVETPPRSTEEPAIE